MNHQAASPGDRVDHAGARGQLACRPPRAQSVAPRGRGGSLWRLVGVTACLLLLAACGASSSNGTGNSNISLPSSIASTHVLKVLTDPVFSPISYYQSGSPGSTIIGSDPDILRAMGKKLGVRVQFVPIAAFTGLIPGVQSGRGDVAAGGLTDTVQREGAVSFVDDFSLGELWVVRKGSHSGITANPLSACGHTVAYTIGAVSATAIPKLSSQCTAAGKPAITLVAVDGINDTVLAVLSGRADVTMYDDIGFDSLNSANHGELQAFTINPYPRQYWGFAVSKSDPQLAKALLTALKEVEASGQYVTILRKYDVAGDALLKPGINLQASHPQN
jgi:polar amino acid transport system substrate-binding protein